MNEDQYIQGLPDLMLGHKVIVEYICGPRVGDEQALDRVIEGEVLEGRPEARTQAFWLHGVADVGIEVSKNRDGGEEVFIPWSAVLALYGYDRERLEKDYTEVPDRQENPQQTDAENPT